MEKLPLVLLNDFLYFTKKLIKTFAMGQIKFPVHIVMGNESADPDSVFGAVCLAYLKFLRSKIPLHSIMN